MKSKKILIAGPWVGEFGWELFAWQGYIRSLSEHFEETIIICRPSSQPLYRDFAHSFIDSAPTIGQPDSYFMYNLDINKHLMEVLRSHKNLLNNNSTMITPRRIGTPPWTHYLETISFGNYKIQPKYRSYGKKVKPIVDYVFHLRSRNLREEDNWSHSNWERLLQLLTHAGKRVGCIGTSDSSGHIEGSIDFRDAPLSKVFDILKNAECTFGSSSGPMHLASLCESPHVVWSIPKNYVRYTQNWNPLSTPVLFLSDQGWHPTADYIYEKFINWGDK